MQNCAPKHRLSTEAKRLGISKEQLRNWMKRRIVPFIKINNTVLFDPAKVDKALEQFERVADSR